MSADTPLACPACEYPVPPGSARCTECGFAPSADDWANRARRDFFMEFTRSSWRVAVGACAAVSLLVPYQLPFFLLLIALASTRMVARGVPRLYAALVRRAWLVALPWIIMPWLVLGMLLRIAMVSGIARAMTSYYGYSDWEIPMFLRLEGRGAFGGVVISVSILIITLVCRTLWRFRWKQLCRLAAIPDMYRTSAVAVIGTRLSFYPGLLLAGAVMLTCGASQILDLFWPGWDR